MRRPALLIGSATWFALACGEGTGPTPPSDGQRLASQFERLADSVDAGGYSPAADALRHAAEIVRLTGHATPVNLTLDGSTRPFLAVAEQIDYPNLVCSWPSDSGFTPPPDTIGPPPDPQPVPPPDPGPIDSSGSVPPDGREGGGGVGPGDPDTPVDTVPAPPECTVAGTYSMRTLIAWEPERMSEVVRIVADVGSNTVTPDVPDVMTGLPSTAADGSGDSAPPDSAPSGGGGGGSPGYPGFMGEYLVREVGSWYAAEGSQANVLEEVSGACTDAKATFDWAEFVCEAARLRFEFSMRVEPLRYERLTGVVDPPNGPEGSHTLRMTSSPVDGVRLTWTAWTPPPVPPQPGPVPEPVDSSGARQ